MPFAAGMKLQESHRARPGQQSEERKKKMKKEQFTALGLTEEQAKKAAEESEKELKDYIPKHRFDEVNTENKSLKEAVKENEKALEELKQNTGDAAALQEQIKKLQEEAEKNKTMHEEEIKELKLNNAVKAALSGIAQDEDIITGLLDKTKLILGEDGKVTGLEEQLKNLKETKAFLFKETEGRKPGLYRLGAPRQEGQGTQSKDKPASMKEAIQAKLESQMQQNN